MSLGNIRLSPIGEALVERLTSDDTITIRYRVTRQWSVDRDFGYPAVLESQVFDPYGTPDGTYQGSSADATPPGSNPKIYPTCLLIDQKLSPAKNPADNQILTKVYTTVLPGDLIPTAEEKTTKTFDGRIVKSIPYVCLSSDVDALGGTIGDTTLLPGFSLFQVTGEAASPVSSTLTRYFIAVSPAGFVLSDTSETPIRRQSLTIRTIKTVAAPPPTPAGYAATGSGTTNQDGYTIYTGTFEIGGDTIKVNPDGRHTNQRVIVQTLAQTYTPGIPGTSTLVLNGVSYVLEFEVDEENGICRHITQDWVEATSTPYQFGNTEIRDIPHCWKGTDPDTYEIISTTVPAREFTYRYLVAGNTAENPASWIAINTQMASLGRYYIGGSIIVNGIAYTIIEQIYAECPDPFSYTKQIKLSIPGVIGVSQPLIRTLSATVIERYSLTQPGRTPLGFDVQQYATINVTATVSGDSASQSFAINKPGYLTGGYSQSAINTTINGIKYSSYIATSSSIPTTVPTGTVVISSEPEPWLGGMFKLTDTEVTL